MWKLWSTKHHLCWLNRTASNLCSITTSKTLRFCSLYELQEELMRMVAEGLIWDSIWLVSVCKEKRSSCCHEHCWNHRWAWTEFSEQQKLVHQATCGSGGGLDCCPIRDETRTPQGELIFLLLSSSPFHYLPLTHLWHTALTVDWAPEAVFHYAFGHSILHYTVNVTGATCKLISYLM